MAAAFNRRMRKTARPVVWEGAGAQSPAPDPIVRMTRRPLFLRLRFDKFNPPALLFRQLPCNALVKRDESAVVTASYQEKIQISDMIPVGDKSPVRRIYRHGTIVPEAVARP